MWWNITNTHQLLKWHFLVIYLNPARIGECGVTIAISDIRWSDIRQVFSNIRYQMIRYYQTSVVKWSDDQISSDKSCQMGERWEKTSAFVILFHSARDRCQFCFINLALFYNKQTNATIKHTARLKFPGNMTMYLSWKANVYRPPCFNTLLMQ